MNTRSLIILISLACTAIAVSVAGVVPQPTVQDDLTAASARAQIAAVYDAWGRARIEYDEEVIEKTLAPDFHVLLNGRRIEREEFKAMVLRKSPNMRLTRFDVEILTVQKAEDGWTAVIAEKIELEATAADGTTQKARSLWVTRDGFRKEGDRWLVTYSEAIGYENWSPGEKPPFKDW